MTRELADVARPVRTARPTIRRATETDLEATWRYRRLDGLGYALLADEWRARAGDRATRS